MTTSTYKSAGYATADVDPYPGLRPYDREEAGLFFGRDAQVDQLLERLATQRFLAVVGVSGCGKSSLVRAGLLPALEAGLLARAGAHWRFVTMRPGGHPLRNLGRALLEATALGETQGRSADAEAFLRAKLRGGPASLVETLRGAGLEAGENVLLLVDQFEEVFRFRDTPAAEETEAFVALLLATARRDDWPIHIVLTMRSDFLGDCARFLGLPEALNDSQFLTPRMTREQLGEAIEGPAAASGGAVTADLVNRLLNDLGSDPDQLPLMQHVLMRLWRRARGTAGDTVVAATPVLGLDDYLAIGGLAGALERHAEEIYGGLTAEQQRIVEVVFRGLSERDRRNLTAGARDTRRPAQVKTLAAIAGTTEQSVIEVAEILRRPGLNLLAPPPSVALTGDTLLDITHESLLQRWGRLRNWVQAEFRSGETYRRLLEGAQAYQENQGDLLDRVSLNYILDWQRREKPSTSWAARYGGQFDVAMKFLDDSKQNLEQREREERERRKVKEKLRFVSWLATVAFVGIAVSLGLLGWALMAQRNEHEANKQLTTKTKELAANEVLLEQRASDLILNQAELKETSDLLEKRNRASRVLRLANVSDMTMADAQRSTLLAAEAWKAAGTLRGTNLDSSDPLATAARREAELTLRGALARMSGTALPGDDSQSGSIFVVDSGPDTSWLVALKLDGKLAVRALDAAEFATGLDLPGVAKQPAWRELPGALDPAESPPRLITIIARDPDAGRPAATRAPSPTGNITGGWYWLVVQGKTGALWLWGLRWDERGRTWTADRRPLAEEKTSAKAVVDANRRWLYVIERPLSRPPRQISLPVPPPPKGTVRIWDADAAEPAASRITVEIPEGALLTNYRSFSGDRRWFTLLKADGEPLIWRVDASGSDQGSPRTPVQLMRRPPARDAAKVQVKNGEFTDDGRLIVCFSDGTIDEWRLDKGQWVVESHRLMTQTADVSVYTDKRGLWAIAVPKQYLYADQGGPQVPPFPLSPAEAGLKGLRLKETAELFDLSRRDAKPIRLRGIRGLNVNTPFVYDVAKKRLLAARRSPADLLVWHLGTDEAIHSPIAVQVWGWRNLSDIQASPEGRWLVASKDNVTATVQVCDLGIRPRAAVYSLPSNAPVLRLPGNEAPIKQTRLSPNGRWLVTLTTEYRIRLWDLWALSPSLEPLQIRNPPGHRTVVITPKHDWVVVSRQDGTLRFWDVSRPKLERYEYSLLERNHFASLQASEDGRWLLWYAKDVPAQLWELRSSPSWPRPRCTLGKIEGMVTRLIVEPGSDPRWLAATIQKDGTPGVTADQFTVRLWDLRTARAGSDPPEQATVRPLPVEHGWTHAFAAVGPRLVIQTAQEFVVLDLTPDPARVARKVPLNLGSRGITQRLVTPDGLTAVIFPEQCDAEVYRLDDATAPTRKLDESKADESRGPPYTELSLSANGRWLLGYKGGTAYLWNLHSKDEVIKPITLSDDESATPAIRRPVMSPDRNWVFTYAYQGHHAVLWDLRGKPEDNLRRLSLAVDGGIGEAVFTTDSLHLVAVGTASDRSFLRVWHLNALKPTEANQPALSRDLPDNPGVQAAAMTPDGCWLAVAGSQAGRIRVWGLRAGDAAEPVTLVGSGFSNQLFLLPDGSKAVTIDTYSEIIRVFTIDANRLMDVARRTVGRNLRPDEWRQFVIDPPHYERTFPDLPEPPLRQTKPGAGPWVAP